MSAKKRSGMENQAGARLEKPSVFPRTVELLVSLLPPGIQQGGVIFMRKLFIGLAIQSRTRVRVLTLAAQACLLV